MFKNFFQARDELDRAILGDDIELSAIALAVFRFLLSHTFYDARSYGHVNYDVCGTETLISLTGYAERSVKRAIHDLKAARLIHVRPRPKYAGGSDTAEISIIWAVFHAEDDQAESATEALSDRPESATEAPESATEAPSSFMEEREEPTSSRRHDDVGSSTPSGETRDRAKGSAQPSSTRAGKASSAGSGARSDKVPGGSGVPAVEDAREFISWLSAVLGVPESSINRKVILGRLQEVVAEFPGMMWTDLEEDISWFRLLPDRTVGHFHQHLPEFFEAVSSARELEGLSLDDVILKVMSHGNFTANSAVDHALRDLGYDVDWSADVSPAFDRLLKDGRIVDDRANNRWHFYKLAA